MMKIAVFFILIGACFAQCKINHPSKKEEIPTSLEKSIRSDLNHLKFDFYGDTNGTIYHRIIDYTSGGIEGVYRYNSYGRFFSDEIDNYKIVELQEMLDLPSFKKSAIQDPTGRILYFEDINYTYSLLSVAEGAIFHIELK